MRVHTKKPRVLHSNPCESPEGWKDILTLGNTLVIHKGLSVILGAFWYEPEGVEHPSNLTAVIATLRMCIRGYTIADYILLEKLIYLYFHFSQLIFFNN